MAKSRVGVQFVEDQVKRVAGEDPLDQNMMVSVDKGMKAPIFIRSVKDENDVFKKAPVVGKVDTDKKVKGKSIKDLLDSDFLKENLHVNTDSIEGTMSSFSESPEGDAFSINDLKWMDDPKNLVWKSALAAHLQAKLNATSYFLNRHSDLSSSLDELSNEDKVALAVRARELADELQEEALTSLNQETAEASKDAQKSVKETKERFKNYISEDFSQDDFDYIFEG